MPFLFNSFSLHFSLWGLFAVIQKHFGYRFVLTGALSIVYMPELKSKIEIDMGRNVVRRNLRRSLVLPMIATCTFALTSKQMSL